MCEQVSHHPPVSAFHAQSDNFRFHGSIHPKLKFWGKSIEITPKGTVTLHLLKYDHSLQVECERGKFLSGTEISLVTE